MRRHSFTLDSAGRALGVASIVAFAALALCLNAKLFTKVHIMNTASAADRIDVEAVMPDLDGAIGWLNSAPLNPKSLRGKGGAGQLLDVYLH